MTSKSTGWHKADLKVSLDAFYAFIADIIKYAHKGIAEMAEYFVAFSILGRIYVLLLDLGLAL